MFLRRSTFRLFWTSFWRLIRCMPGVHWFDLRTESSENWQNIDLARIIFGVAVLAVHFTLCRWKVCALWQEDASEQKSKCFTCHWHSVFFFCRFIPHYYPVHDHHMLFFDLYSALKTPTCLFVLFIKLLSTWTALQFVRTWFLVPRPPSLLCTLLLLERRSSSYRISHNIL